jgi:hypothetical protein
VSLFSAGTGRATRDESGGGNTVSRRRDRARALEPGDVARESRGVREIFGAAETNASRRAGTRAIPDLGSYPSQEVGELVRVRRGELADLPRRLVPRSGRRAGLEQAEKPVEPAAPAIVSHDCGRAPRRLKRKADAFFSEKSPGITKTLIYACGSCGGPTSAKPSWLSLSFLEEEKNEPFQSDERTFIPARAGLGG